MLIVVAHIVLSGCGLMTNGNVLPSSSPAINQVTESSVSHSMQSTVQDSLDNDHEYAFTAWSEFGQCSKVCGGGSRARTRSCLSSTAERVIMGKCYDQLAMGTYDLFTVVEYGKELSEENEEICNEHECQTSEWEMVTTCTRECGGGTLTKFRTCLDSTDQSECNFQSKKLDPCNTATCFNVQEWQKWSRCVIYSDVGETSRHRQCTPNAPPNSDLYKRLESLMTTFGGISMFDGPRSDEQIHYFSQYLGSCSRLHQKRYCSVKPCPEKELSEC